MKRILVATDGSPSSVEAVGLGVELAAEHDEELIFVHAVPTLDVVPARRRGRTAGRPSASPTGG